MGLQCYMQYFPLSKRSQALKPFLIEISPSFCEELILEIKKVKGKNVNSLSGPGQINRGILHRHQGNFCLNGRIKQNKIVTESNEKGEGYV